MSLKLVIVAVHLLLLLVVDFSSGNFCDQGPPGRYCYKDLTGWYDCKIDAKTQKMTETKHNCPPNKRWGDFRYVGGGGGEVTLWPLRVIFPAFNITRESHIEENDHQLKKLLIA